MEKNEKHLSIFSFKSLLLLCLIGGFLWVFCIPYAPDIGDEARYTAAWQRLEKAEKNPSYDIIFFGNSHCYTAYDPSYIENNLGLDALHINSSAQRLETSLAIAEEVIANYKLKYAIFDVSDGVQWRPELEEEEAWYYQAVGLQEVPLSRTKASFVAEYFPIERYPEYALTAVSKKLGRILRLNRRSEYKVRQIDQPHRSPKTGIWYSYNGYWASDHPPVNKDAFPRRSALQEVRKETDSLWGKNVRNKLEYFIQKAKQKNIEVILLNSLKLYRTNFNREYIEYLKIQYDNVQFLDLNENRSDYVLDATSFYNTTHLNFPGSYQVTERLCDSLSSWYGHERLQGETHDFGSTRLIDVFVALQPHQEKFIKLTFEGRPDESLENHMLVMSIYPRDTSLLSEYSKKRGFGSDNYYIETPFESAMGVGKDRIMVKHLDTFMEKEDIERIKVYFYREGDTLGLSSFFIDPNAMP